MYKYTLICLFSIGIFGCNNAPEQVKINESPKAQLTSDEAAHTHATEAGTFVHTVLFWMKEDMTKDQAKDFEKGLIKLGTVKSIDKYEWGTPAKKVRDDGVVDDSYDYAWITYHKDAAAQDAYQVDPIHLEFVKSYEQLFEKVIVYDFITK